MFHQYNTSESIIKDRQRGLSFQLIICYITQVLRGSNSLYWPIDRYHTDPGGQVAYHNSHKTAFSLWRKWIRTVECGILVIKRTVKTLQIGSYSVFLKVPIKHIQEKKKFDCKRKRTFIYLNFSSIATFKKKYNIFYVNFVSWNYIYFG